MSTDFKIHYILCFEAEPNSFVFIPLLYAFPGTPQRGFWLPLNKSSDFRHAVGKPCMVSPKWFLVRLAEHHTRVSYIQSKAINHGITRVYQLTYCSFMTRGRDERCFKPCLWFSNQSGMKPCHLPL